MIWRVWCLFAGFMCVYVDRINEAFCLFVPIVFEIGTCCGAQTGLELGILLLQLPCGWYDSCMPLFLAIESCCSRQEDSCLLVEVHQARGTWWYEGEFKVLKSSSGEDRCFSLVPASFLGQGWMNLEPCGGTGFWPEELIYLCVENKDVMICGEGHVRSNCMPFHVCSEVWSKDFVWSKTVPPVSWCTLPCGWWVCLLACFHCLVCSAWILHVMSCVLCRHPAFFWVCACGSPELEHLF